MRIFFLFLLIINLLFAGWQYTQPDKRLAAIRALPEGLQTVQLLNQQDVEELVDNGSAGDAPEVQVAEPLEPSPPARVYCYTLGPFSDEAAVLDIKSQISEQVQDLLVRKREESERHRYWIYLPPLENRQQAIAMSKSLARRKINDYYIVRSGDKNNSISLGHFREKNHADRRVRELKKLGVDAQMEVIYRQYSLFWLDYSRTGSKPPTDELISPYLVDGVARLDRACN